MVDDKLIILIEKFYNIYSIIEGLVLTHSLKSITKKELHMINIIGVKSLTISELAIELGISNSACTMFVKKMTENDIIVKKHSLKDKRQVVVCLSNKGKQIFDKYRMYHNEIINEITKEISEENMRKLSIYLERILLELDNQQDYIKRESKKSFFIKKY